MAQYAIIFTANRVITRVTTDSNLAIGAQETMVGPLDPPITLQRPPGVVGWKLSLANEKIECTVQELRDAGLDDAFNKSEQDRKWQELRQATIAMRDDVLVPASVKQFSRKLLEVIR